MFAAFRSARRKSSNFALAIALAGGAAFSTAAFAPSAYAQDQDYSPAFVAAYQPVAAMTQGETPDHAGARAQIETVLAAATTADDRMAAGNLALMIGQNTNDDVLRRRGIEIMIASGKVPADQLGQFHYYVANFAFNAGDYPAVRSAVTAALANGYVDNDDNSSNDPEYLYMQSYSSEENAPAAVAYVVNLAAERMAAGQSIPERWLLRGLQDSYDGNLGSEATSVSEMLLRAYPTQQNWINSMQVIAALNELDAPARIDLSRLALANNAMTTRREFVSYIEDLDPRIMGSEVVRVLQAGLAAGQFDAGDAYYIEVRDIATPRAATDRRQIATYIREGETGDALDALATGDVLYSLEDYVQAERFFQLALERGMNANTAHTRIGIAQAMQGKYTEAKEHFAQVTGPRTAIAKLWSVYVDQMMAM
ncbi:hypothetical protein [Aurantiacibacter marinus]|uniref:Uncharacterized protein n=1 Tax=Aurantiacibacter marinus TaxID=874156 RepID=A0A0H0XUH2_9SPHN|nr:hypothetical protein [Aurantiacibacter marinus]KLI63925.1 hypothetical protein AAV99_09535 [Aurantiacibacter marinus]